MCPVSSPPHNSGPLRFSPTFSKDWRPCRKSMTSACERCRRRKIRCDESTPCSTCKHFALPCIRPQKPPEVVASEHRAALAGRIHQLESQLAARDNAPMQDMVPLERHSPESVPSLVDWHNARSQFNFGPIPPPSLTADGSNLREFTKSDSMPPMSMDEIESTAMVAPSSLPAPSPWPNTLRASSLPLITAPSNHAPASRSSFRKKFLTESIQPHVAPSWEFMANASFDQPSSEITGDLGHSRKRSVSSFSLDSTVRSMAPSPEPESDLLLLDPAPFPSRQGLPTARLIDNPTSEPSRSSFADRNRAITSIPIPSLFEAKTLTAGFAQYIYALEPRPYSVPPPLFSRFCELVYPLSHRAGPEISISIQMARFHVFLAMAIAMKLRIRDSLEDTNALLNICYDLAIQQSTASTFWQQSGGREVAQLLLIFASVQKALDTQSRSRQQSFSC